MKISLLIPGIPQPKQSCRARIIKTKPGKSFIHTYQTKDVVRNEYNIKSIILSQLPANFQPFRNEVRINKLNYVFPPLSNFSKAVLNNIQEGNIIYKKTKPDLVDNLNKGLFDAMQGIVFINDSQVCEMQNVKKFYGFTPRIEVELEEI